MLRTAVIDGQYRYVLGSRAHLNVFGGKMKIYVASS